MSYKVVKKVFLGSLFLCLLSLAVGQFWITLASPPPALGQTQAAQPINGFPLGLTLTQNEYKPDFPSNITFRFAATVNREINPNFPELRWLELAFRREGEVATSVRRFNLPANQTTLKNEYKLDTRREYIPPGARISYYWRLGDRAGNFYETPRQVFTYQDTRFEFKELKNDLLTVRWYQGDANFGQAAFDKARQTIDRLGRLYNIKPDRPMVVTLYPDSRTLFTVLPPNTQEWVGGQAAPELGTVVMAVAPGDLTEVNRTIPHEISHLVIYQATRNPYNTPPKWLDEGLAVLNQEQVDGFMTQAFEQAKEKKNLYPLRVLSGIFPADTQQSYLAYGQSVEVVRYILQKYGEAGIARMLAAFKDGLSYDEIVQAGLGIGLDQLDKEWKQAIGYLPGS